MQTVKHGVKKMTSGTLRDKLARFLFQYRITPQTTTGVSPAELLFGRRLRSCLDALYPNLAERVERKQQGQKAAERSFQEQDSVYVKYYERGGGGGGGGGAANENGCPGKSENARSHYHLMCG